ncbi:MAG TPA: hypothetical protein VJ179_01220 [Patescibacteria group bacterium]|nr:hypothetical protein [Patescibacteria group bacterium]
MKVFIGGYWDPKRAVRYASETKLLGRLLAERGHDVIVGPGSGVVRFLVEGFREVSSKGNVIFYLPKKKELIRTGEELTPFADEVIRTEEDYLHRMITMCEDADGYASIAGASGTIAEAVSMMFLKKPVTMLEEAGAASNAGQILGGLKVYAYFSPTVEKMVDYLEQKFPISKLHKFEEEWYNI